MTCLNAALLNLEHLELSLQHVTDKLYPAKRRRSKTKTGC